MDIKAYLMRTGSEGSLDLDSFLAASQLEVDELAVTLGYRADAWLENCTSSVDMLLASVEELIDGDFNLNFVSASS